jgi:hypothetical protein
VFVIILAKYYGHARETWLSRTTGILINLYSLVEILKTSYFRCEWDPLLVALVRIVCYGCHSAVVGPEGDADLVKGKGRHSWH